MMSAQKAWAFLAVAGVAVLPGCRIEVSQSNVARIVKTALKTRRSSPSYSMDIQVWKGSGAERRIVHCTIEKDGANTFSYSFRDGTRYWSTPDGCVLTGPEGARAEVFSGLPEPAEAELREALRWGASRYIRRHSIIAELFTREGQWKGHRVSATPLHPGPFDRAGEQFVDKRSRAKVLVVERDARGEVIRRRLTRSVRVTRCGEFELPSVPEGDVVRFAAGPEGAAAPEWARAPAAALEILSAPRARHSDGLAVYDMSKGGFVFVLFERRAGSEALRTSPIAHTADLGGAEISTWSIGEKFMYRWRDGELEFSLLGNVPPDLAWKFLVANVSAGRALASRAVAEGAFAEGALPR
jgi:hypothetical protein